MKKFLSIIKKVSIVAALIAAVTSAGPLLGLQPSAQAAGCDNNATMLGLPVWYRGLCVGGNIDTGDKSVGAVVLIVALNGVDIVLRILSLVANGFLIYGGFQYMIARGEPGLIAKGKSTVTQAIVGLIIGIASSAIVGFIVGRLG